MSLSEQPAAEIRRLVSRLPGLGSPWSPVLVGALAASLASLSWVQWLRPYLEHDDWDMLLPDGPSFVERHAARLLYEGRWLNGWWWSVASQSLGPRAAAVLFGAGWLIVVAVLVRSFSIGWWAVPAVAAIYGSPMISTLSFWPATLAAPMAMTALTCAALWLTRHRWVAHLAALAVGTVLIGLGYPPLALFPLALVVALHHHRSWKRLAMIGLVVVAGYVTAIVIVFTLNWIRFDHFGLRIQSWRHPNPLTGPASLARHLTTVAADWVAVFRPLMLPLLAAAVALVAGAFAPRIRRRMLVLGLALACGAALTAASTITTGVDVPPRGMAWFWPLTVLGLSWCVVALRGRRQMLAAAALAFVASWATLYAAFATLDHQPERTAFNQLAQAIFKQHEADPRAPIMFALPAPNRVTPERQAVVDVGGVLAKIDHIETLHHCNGCRLTLDVSNPRDPATWVHTIDGEIVVEFPQSIGQADLTPQPEPEWLVPLS